MAADETPPPRDPRPRPQYGEYASPQDQANAIAVSLPPVPPVLLPSDRPSSVAPAAAGHAGAGASPVAGAGTRAAGTRADSSVQHSSVPGHTQPDPGSAAASARQPRRWDLIISAGLLVYGFLNVVSGLFQYADLDAFLDELYASFGIGDYVATGMERPIGIAMVAVNLVSFALVAWFTVRALRAHRVAFWIPLVGGLVATVVTAVLLQILVAGDPALMTYLDGLLQR